VARAGVADSNGDVVIEGEGAATGDAVLVAQVLQNLVMNALQAGSSLVTVRISPARVDVVDNGPGIPPESSERIFLPFFTTKTRGTGLGLPMARRIAEAMQGRLDLASRAASPPLTPRSGDEARPPTGGDTGCHFRFALRSA
jgi:signal transduction histidine kinase